MLRLQAGLKFIFLRSTALALALLVSAGTIVVAQKLPSGSAAHLTVGVKVEPICTVTVTPERSADEAIDLQCRNLPDSHPEPVVRAVVPTVSEPGAVPGDVTTVVINF